MVEQLERKIMELEQKNKRLKSGLTYLLELAREKLGADDGSMGADSIVLVTQIIEVANDSLNYEFSFGTEEDE